MQVTHTIEGVEVTTELPDTGNKLICEICTETVGVIVREKLAYPLRGEMFKSPDPFHGFSDPFPPEQTWEEMRCGYCRCRPFIAEDRILTDRGYLAVDAPQEVVDAVDDEVTDEPNPDVSETQAVEAEEVAPEVVKPKRVVRRTARKPAKKPAKGGRKCLKK